MKFNKLAVLTLAAGLTNLAQAESAELTIQKLEAKRAALVQREKALEQEKLAAHDTIRKNNLEIQKLSQERSQLRHKIAQLRGTAVPATAAVARKTTKYPASTIGKSTRYPATRTTSTVSKKPATAKTSAPLKAEKQAPAKPAKLNKYKAETAQERANRQAKAKRLKEKELKAEAKK